MHKTSAWDDRRPGKRPAAGYNHFRKEMAALPRGEEKDIIEAVSVSKDRNR